jgi:hypothetical protein
MNQTKRKTKRKTKRNLKGGSKTDCSKSFCGKVLKKTRKQMVEQKKKLRSEFLKSQKELDEKMNDAKKKGNKELIKKLKDEYALHKSIMNGFNKIKVSKKEVDSMIMYSCNKFYCNPGCKDMQIKINGDFNNKLPAKFITDLKENGALSGCILNKPPDDVI